MKSFLNKKYIKNKGGFLMLEALVGIFIISVSVISATYAAQKSLVLSAQSLKNLQAAFLLEEGGNVVKILRSEGWSNISSLSVGTNYYPTFTNGSWSLSLTPSQIDGIFTRTVQVNNVNRDAATGDIVTSGGVLDAGTKQVSVTVSWQYGTSTFSKDLSFYLIDIL